MEHPEIVDEAGNTADSTLMKLSRLVGRVYDGDRFGSELIGEPAPTNPG